jgi:hypothetical protein
MYLAKKTGSGKAEGGEDVRGRYEKGLIRHTEITGGRQLKFQMFLTPLPRILSRLRS